MASAELDKYRSNMYMEFRTNDTAVTLEELEANTTYEFQVAAQTRLGVGLAAQLPVTTKTVGMLTLQLHKVPTKKLEYLETIYYYKKCVVYCTPLQRLFFLLCYTMLYCICNNNQL